jgi:hypothetical protein
MEINTQKTKLIGFRRPEARYVIMTGELEH